MGWRGERKHAHRRLEFNLTGRSSMGNDLTDDDLKVPARERTDAL